MDYADTELGAGLWGTGHHVRRTITGIEPKINGKKQVA